MPNTIIPLTRGQVTLISMEDVDLVQFKWYAMRSRYRFYATRSLPSINGSRKHQLLHRIILERILGKPLNRKEQVDHINGDGLDNRRENLRLATHNQNQWNSRKLKTNTSGYKGVGYYPNLAKWWARIRVNGRRIHLGYFATPELAYKAYCEAAVKYHGEFARFE